MKKKGKEKGIAKVLSCFVIITILMSAVSVSVLASNSNEVVMGDTLDSLSEVDTHEDIVVSGVDNATNEAAYDLSDSNITGNTSNPSNEAVTQEEVVGSSFADGVSAKSSTYQTITVLVEYPDGSTITPDTILILYNNSWNEVKRADTNGYTRYTFTDLDVGTYHVEAYKDNMFIGSAGNISVGAGEGKFVTIKTFSKRNLDVAVYYNDGSTPIKGATVNVYSWDGYNKRWDYEYEGITNSQGKVTFSCWPTSCSGEKYKLVVEHNGYSKTKEPVYVDKDSGSSYTITTDEPTEKPFYIRPACQDVDGNHLDGVSYEFVDYPTYKGTCDYNEYLIAPGHGSYKVKFMKGDSEATVTLESHLKTFAGTVVTVRKTEKSDIIVIVKDHDDNAVTPDTAILYIPSGDVWKEVKRLNPTSNAYTFTGLDAGTYHTEAYKDNVFIGSAENIELPVGVCQIAYITTLYKRNLEAKVCYKDGSTPVVGATVKVYSWDGHNKKWDYEYDGITNSQGKVTFSSWPTSCSGEKYKLEVEHNGYSKTKEPVFVDRDKGGSYEIRLDESLLRSVDYTNIAEYMSNATTFHRGYTDKWLNPDWWGDLAKKEPKKILPEAIDSAYKAPLDVMIALIPSTLLNTVTTALSFANLGWLLTKIGIIGTKTETFVLVANALDQSQIPDLNSITINGNNIVDTTKNNNKENLISHLKIRKKIIKNIYNTLDELDASCFESVVKSKLPLITAYSRYYAYMQLKLHIIALHYQLQEDYAFTTHELNKLAGKNGYEMLNKESTKGRIKPYRLDASPRDPYYLGCLDYKNDVNDFNIVVDKRNCGRFKALNITVTTNPGFKVLMTLRNEGGNIVKQSTKSVEITPEEGIYMLRLKAVDGPTPYALGALIKSTNPLNSDMKVANIFFVGSLTPLQYPKSHILNIHFDKTQISIGEDVTLTVKVTNDGGTASWQSIAVSSPNVTNLDSYEILSHNLDYFKKYDVGYEAGSNYGTETKKLEYPLIEGAKNDWAKGFNGEVKLKIKTEQTGNLRIYVKSIAFGEGVWCSAPEIFETSTKDQQNEYVYVKKVAVTGGGDTTPPETECTLSPSSPNGEYGWYVTPVTVTLESTDPSGIEWIKYRVDSGSWQTYDGSKVSFTVSNDGLHYITYYAKDKAGNEEDLDFSIFFIDKTKPSASISINNGAEHTNSRSVTLYLTYSDNMGVRDCRYKNEGESWTSWESCFSTKSWTLAAGEGTKKVYYQVRDAAGNIKEVYDTIILKQAQPKLCTSPDPPSHDFGTVPKDQTRSWKFDITNCGSGTLTWSVSDDKTWITVNPTSGSTTTETDKVTVTISTHGLTPGTHTGHVTITSNGGSKTGTITVEVPTPPPQPKLCTSPDPPSHDFGIVSKEKGTSWSFGIRNCGSGTLTWSVSDDKTWMTVYPTSGSTTTETDTVTVTIDMESYLYLSPGTHTGHVTINSNGGSKTGTITVIRENQPPTNPTLTPDKSSSQPAGTTIKWTASATDPDGDQLYYRFWLRGPATGNLWQIKRDWSTANTWTWHTTSSDVGDNDISVWIRDGHHASTSSKDLEKIVYDYRVTPEKQRPTAFIDSITPNPATQGKDTVHFKGHGTDTDGYIVAYYWTSSIDGFMSSSKEFTKSASELSVGTHTIYFKVKDNDDQWSDWDTATLTIKPSEKPDLIVSSINFNPNPANKGNDVTVSVTVKNQGKGDAGPHYEFLGYPDRYTLLKEWYCSGLKAGASRTFTHTLENVQSSDTYEACADWGQVVEESNEDNNCLTASLTVQSVSELNYKLDEYGVIQQEYNDDSGINRAAPPATDAMVLAPYIDLIPYGSVSDKVRVEIGIKNGQVTEYDPTGNAILSSGRSKLTWSNQDVTTDYHAELFYEANFRHTREVEAKIIPDQLKAEVRNICSYPLYNIIVLYPDPELGYWHYETLDYLGAGAKRTISLSNKQSPESIVSSLNTYLASALNNFGLDATQHRNDWISEWLNYWLGMSYGSTHQPRVIYRIPQNLYKQYFTCSASPEPSKGMVRVGLVELFNVPTPTPSPSCCPSMSISTGQDTYMPGDNVYVSITLTGRSGCTFRLNSPSIVSLIAPTGETVTQTDMAQGITSSIAPGGHHTIGRSMKLPLNAPLGRYDVKVSLSGGKCTKTANGLFQVVTV